jgi:hypothetical protein
MKYVMKQTVRGTVAAVDRRFELRGRICCSGEDAMNLRIPGCSLWRPLLLPGLYSRRRGRTGSVHPTSQTGWHRCGGPSEPGYFRIDFR